MTDDLQKNDCNAIGEAWLEEDGTIVLQMHRTTDGLNMSGQKKYKIDDKFYDEVWRHLGGLKPGERKLVQPWP